MTEERKQELRQLLQEATAPENLEIRQRSANSSPLSPIDIHGYGVHLRQYWKFYTETSLWVVTTYEPNIINEAVKSKLLGFIRVEFASFIDEDKILSASFFLIGGFAAGFPLDYLLRQLLKITIAYGTEKAASTFDKCTKETQGSFQDIAVLEGIKLASEIQVFDGIRLIPLPNSTSELRRYLPSSLLWRAKERESSFIGKTLLVVDCSVSPIFHKPFQTSTIQEHEDQKNRTFWVEVNSKDLPNLKADSYPPKFLCEALSLACNSGVNVSFLTRFLAEDKLYNLSHEMGGFSWASYPSGKAIKVGHPEIEKAKRLYKKLANPNSEIAKKLQIPTNRWIQSKANKDPENKIIDLGIALESLYLPKNKTDQLSLSLRLRAAWHLGENKAHRKELIDEFDAIYTLRSEAVHNGELSPKVKIRKGNKAKQGKSIPTSEFIPRAQELCRDSIIKILEDGEFPDDDYWKDLILG